MGTDYYVDYKMKDGNIIISLDGGKTKYNTSAKTPGITRIDFVRNMDFSGITVNVVTRGVYNKLKKYLDTVLEK